MHAAHLVQLKPVLFIPPHIYPSHDPTPYVPDREQHHFRGRHHFPDYFWLALVNMLVSSVLVSSHLAVLPPHSLVFTPPMIHQPNE